MAKGFHYIHLPRLIMPKDLLDEQQLEGMTRPLQLCQTCHYVLCSCGNCHNTKLCNEPCLYEEAASG